MSCLQPTYYLLPATYCLLIPARIIFVGQAVHPHVHWDWSLRCLCEDAPLKIVPLLVQVDAELLANVANVPVLPEWLLLAYS